MKYIVIVGDGMADYPLRELNGKTPLQAANTPNMDHIAKRGKCGTLSTVPQGMKVGSDIANLSIMGYDPQKYYTGRGPLEAASIGVTLGENDLAFRCNIITEENGNIKDYCADHISSEQAEVLIEELNRTLPNIGEFFPGVSYRQLFVLRNTTQKIVSTPPHDVINGRIKDHLLKPLDNPMAADLNDLILRSNKVLSKHNVNLERIKNGLNPGNMIWLWGQGPRPNLEPFQEKYDLRGSVVTAVDLIKGIGYYAGMKIINVDGATGYYDTNYEGKAKATVKALEESDYIYVHVESIDEASHAGDIDMKLKTIEDLDKRLIGRIIDAKEEDWIIGLLTDHATPISTRTHSSDPVPFAIWGEEHDDTKTFNEVSVKNGFYKSLVGDEFMKSLLDT